MFTYKMTFYRTIFNMDTPGEKFIYTKEEFEQNLESLPSNWYYKVTRSTGEGIKMNFPIRVKASCR